MGGVSPSEFRRATDVHSGRAPLYVEFLGHLHHADRPWRSPVRCRSIKSAFIFHHGMCAKRVDALPILVQLQDGLFSSFATAATAQGCADAEQYWSLASTYLSHSEAGNPDYNPQGGFIWNAYLGAHVKIPGAADTNLRFNVDFSWGLNDGILTASSNVNATDYNGTSSGSGGQTLDAAFTYQIPQAIFDGAIGSDPYATKGQYFNNPLGPDCARLNGVSDVPAPYETSNCQAAIAQMVTVIQNAAKPRDPSDLQYTATPSNGSAALIRRGTRRASWPR
jgi:hypothetical protein